MGWMVWMDSFGLWSLFRDLFAELGLRSVGGATAEVSFCVCSILGRARGIAEMMTSGGGFLKQGMPSLIKYAALKERVGGWEWADMMMLYCRNVAEEDSEFARRIGVLLQEMEARYNERVDFITELSAPIKMATTAEVVKKKVSYIQNDIEFADKVTLYR
ncbi:hypothetical protein Tco_1499662 [Tanacetum coccineum]